MLTNSKGQKTAREAINFILDWIVLTVPKDLLSPLGSFFLFVLCYSTYSVQLGASSRAMDMAALRAL